MSSPVSRSVFLRNLALAAGSALLLATAGARVMAQEPAAAQIDSFDNSLISVMKEGAPYRSRYAKLKPAVQRTLDLPAMTRYAVGSTWSSLSESDRSQLIAAFTHLTVASYAHNFDSYSGQKFTIDPNIPTRGTDKLVRTQLVSTSGSPVTIAYRMRETGGSWKVIDIYFSSISQLTTRRSDFASTLASGGASALVAHLNRLADNLAN